eukprot:CAMPEP_0173407312 /NCGR_PEP_ID=MMETSP1356-20130122/66798_1 /TAXON_ID=77927 ORGANISM="Hemiselmis virescens, Strain PCC157" /NCGR_SAMPLE_ID=MMETSP1356 /ASSEMBLY_ACC=CAM_ASM_000847 /LENGTH=250 /DNA_ID=CAMNT_0014368469 /DNA_START=62 /DNA_END=814 /DNA_ORIENTATION=+
MSNMQLVLAAEVAYFVTIFGIQWFMGKAPATDGGKPAPDGRLLKLAMCFHNAVLCLVSLAMFIGAGYEAYVRSKAEGITFLFCEKYNTKAQGGLYFWSYIYYLSKFYEFGDTVFKVIKRKPLDFLHVYHHAVVVFMCYNWLDHAQSLQTLGLLFNTFVHIFMYFYYAYTIYNPPPWWKRYITSLQIVQFQSSFVLSLPFAYMHLNRTYVLGVEGCSGAMTFLFNAAFNLSLLLLFVRFSRKSYSDKKKKA